ncbi:MAG: cyclic nucleotide-binding domain-containing protein [Endomicrobiia bacterium]|jgi:signal-transduction protein with cAMP-binding, CBS, and nucleotidyltransferase domain|nr:cyclic nucleotide-binding domain-containing protein [Endomicrobiaceae bacterium]MDD3052978.1 cyclic nucleotide-binding domain-containing protein [Endomicrobiaceae bacterium]MDD3921971.1 cyclic nucleotide-binding domain-containing protein [Endomicrobiaceae bacterium]MDD5101796.1 cyclic nucleotide-binding domain-containing protein [Endomicrobiaceae bacterium]
MFKKMLINIFIDTEIKNDIKFLENIKIFNKFTVWQLKKIISIIYKKEYLKNEVIYNKGEEAKLFCILKNGKVELYDEKDKKNVEINDVFGQKFLMCDSEIYVNTAKVIEKSVVYIIHKYDFERLMSEDTKIGFKITKILLDNLYNKVQ